MKIIAHADSFSCPGGGADDQAITSVGYSCGTGTLSSSVEVAMDLTKTESQLQDDVRAAVSADVNTKLGSSTTAADVRLL